jgi:RNA polymerase sigma-70 factor (ECF subfamily)
MRALSGAQMSAATSAAANCGRVRPDRFTGPEDLAVKDAGAKGARERSKLTPKTYVTLMNANLAIADVRFAPKPAFRLSNDNAVSRERGACEDRSWRGAVVASFESAKLSKAAARTVQADDPAVFADLVEAIAARADRAAFTRLFAYYGPRVKGYLIRLGLDIAQAEELTQDVMVAVWRKAGSFDRRQASVATWIFRIARNRRIDVFRQERRAMLDAHDPAFQPAPEAAPDVAAETGEREARVRKAMEGLPPEQRELVREAFYEDRSHRQIADRTGMPLGTVKSRLRLAMAKLKLHLDADDLGREG